MKIKCDDFNLDATLESGQVFGFERNADGGFKGNLLGNSVRLSQSNGSLTVERTNGPGPESSIGDTLEKSNVSPMRSNRTIRDQVRSYFDLDRDLEDVYSVLRSDFALEAAFRSFKGLRLIRQDPWEALACFIISSNNNVKRIMGIHRNLVRHFGHFPTSSDIARSHENILLGLGLGYRAPFLLRTATFLSNNPDYLETVRHAPYEEAKARVLAFPGVGPKVADCVLLYGFHKLQAFPVDVWIARAMRRLYFHGRKISDEKIRRFAMKRWGNNAGYVQQYLFHGARMGVFGRAAQ